MTFALNVLAPFLLTNLLLPALEASVPARIINVNSMVYRYGAGLDWNDLQQSRQAYRPLKVYSKARFANLLITYEFARRLAGTGVTVNAVDPGFTITLPELGHAHSWYMLLAWPFMKLNTGRALYLALPQTGTFECFDPLINQLQQKILWSQKSNFLEIPTDCPTRERTGYTGDVQVFAHTGFFLMQTAGFLSKWLKDLAAEQVAGGQVATIVPSPQRARPGKAVSVPWITRAVPSRSHELFMDADSATAHSDAIMESSRP